MRIGRLPTVLEDSVDGLSGGPVSGSAALARVAENERELESIAERVAELSAQIQAATYRLLELVREFDAKDGYLRAGFRTCAAWLAWQTGTDLGACREKVRVARRLPELPLIADAFRAGEISYAKVRAMTRIATAATEEGLLNVARYGTAAQVEKVVRAYRNVDPAEENARARRQQEGRYLKTYFDVNGEMVIEGRMPAELGARVMKALDAVMEKLVAEEAEDPADDVPEEVVEGTLPNSDRPPEPSPPREPYGARRADALVRLADAAMTTDLPGRHVADAHQVVVHVSAESLADPGTEGISAIEDGPNVSAETSRRLACDCSLTTITEDGAGMPIDLGRKRRTISPALRRALKARDGGCQFPGCSHTRYLHAHHIRHWANGGETNLDNLCQLCSFHHQLVHEGGFSVGWEQGTLRFRNPSGIPVLAAPPPPRGDAAIAFDPIDTLRCENHAQLRAPIDGTTAAVWGGDRLDLGWTIDCLVADEARTSLT